MNAAATALTPANLAAILLSLALVGAPHASHLPIWIPVFAGTLLLARFYVGYRRKPLPNRWLLLAVALACVAGVALSYRTLYGRDVGVALLTVMVALKLMEMSAARDTMVVVLLAYFLVITNFLYSQTIPTALYMLLVVLIITATMIGLQHRAAKATPAVALRQSALLILQSVPVMLVLFLLFPRVQGPLWGLPQINVASKSGLSDTMSPGDVSVLGLSDEVAFRVLFEKPPEKPTHLYWRGPVLTEFDGQTWHPGLNLTLSSLEFEALGPPLRYTVTLEPHERRWLFAIDMPKVVPPGGFLTSDFQMRSRRLVRERMRYEMESVPQYRIGVNERNFELSSALRLPSGISPRARALAQSWKQQSASQQEIVARALNMFREQPFIYTLAPPSLGEDFVDEFLFVSRSGFCEHYASSFTFLMRAAGIPARVVTGYLGGEINPVDGYLIVRQSEAHAWTEIWLPGEGWVRVDPTAAVSPLRVEGGLAAAVPDSERNPLLGGNRLDWLKQARFAWDAVANSWNQWVLGYNPERQTQFLSRIGLEQATWQNMVIVLVASSGVVLLLLASTLLLRLVRKRREPVQRFYQAFCNAMARRGAPRRASEGPRDYAARISLQFPELRDAVQRVSALYMALRYGRKSGDTRLLRELRDAVRSFG
jgi:transglutaminase-like putative cysteine protease